MQVNTERHILDFLPLGFLIPPQDPVGHGQTNTLDSIWRFPAEGGDGLGGKEGGGMCWMELFPVVDFGKLIEWEDEVIRQGGPREVVECKMDR